ncbi:hypothetical protein TIFTF001_020403 [Ficus carica]|uniref:Uncharacterized protein n=1 Tax=Ficus carica TaxID=3494 RepID=A0AA88DDM3_FICCA|nr:hypothetical protein TIFTF001_020403 [Ficus carica]
MLLNLRVEKELECVVVLSFSISGIRCLLLHTRNSPVDCFFGTSKRRSLQSPIGPFIGLDQDRQRRDAPSLALQRCVHCITGLLKIVTSTAALSLKRYGTEATTIAKLGREANKGPLPKKMRAKLRSTMELEEELKTDELTSRTGSSHSILPKSSLPTNSWERQHGQG